MSPVCGSLGSVGTLTSLSVVTTTSGGILYTDLIVTEKLFPHLEEIDTACRERLEIIENAMMQQEGVTEALKAAEQMAWVRSMNSIHNRAEEVVLAELVYC